MSGNRVLLAAVAALFVMSALPVALAANGFDAATEPAYIWWDSKEPGLNYADFPDLPISDPNVKRHTDGFCPTSRTDIGFPFQYYGKTQTRVNVMQSGFLSFDPAPCVVNNAMYEYPTGCAANPAAYSWCYVYGYKSWCTPDAVACSAYTPSEIGSMYVYTYYNNGVPSWSGNYCYPGYYFSPMTPDPSGFNAVIHGTAGGLVPSTCGGMGQVLTSTTGPPGSRVFTAQWRDVNHMYPGSWTPKQTFQIQLFEADNHIEVKQRQVQSYYRPLTSGIENLQGSKGVDYMMLNSYASLAKRTEWYYPLPEVTITSDPGKACVGKPTVFHADVEGTAPLGGLARLTWVWGDGSSAVGFDNTKTFAKRDNYTAKLKMIFGNGLTYDHPMTIRVYNCIPPVARFDVATGDEADATFVDRSYDPDGRVVKWDWDFGDDSPHSELQDPGQHFYPDTGKVYFVKLNVTDSEGFSDTYVQNVAVHGKPRYIGPMPNARAGPDQQVSEGQLVQLDGSKGDQSRAVRTTWTQVAGAPVALTNPASARPSFTAPAPVDGVPQRLTFALVLYDGHFTSKPSIVNVTVLPHSSAPTARAGADQIVPEGNLVTLSAASSSDPDNDPLKYTWTQIGGTPVKLSDAHSIAPTFDTPQVGQAGALLAFRVTVSDGVRESSSDTRVQVVRLAEENPGQAIIVTKQTAIAAGLVRFEVAKEEVPGATRFIWSFPDGVQDGAVVDHQFTVSGDQTVKLQATDEAGRVVGSYETTVPVYVPQASVAPIAPAAKATPAAGLLLVMGLLALAVAVRRR